MNAIVLDASVVLAWCFNDDVSGVADESFRSLKGRDRWMPSLLPVEVANLLVLAEKKKRLTRPEAAAFMASLISYDVQEDGDTGNQAFHDTYDIARQYGLTAYDAVYLELALRKEAVLATLDQELRRAAVKAGVPVIKARK